MNHKKILAAVFIAVLPLAAFSKTKTTVKDTLSINFRLNTKSDDGKNYLKWSNSNQKISDKFDAVSGASVSHSTGELFSVIHGNSSKNLLAPKGLRSLLLFAVSSPEFLQKDNFQIEEQDDGKIKITFTHRNVNYLILSGEKGKLDLEKSFFINQNQEQKQDSNQLADSTQTDADANQIQDSTRINTDEKDEHRFGEENLPPDSNSSENQKSENHDNISESENLSVSSVNSVRNSENQNLENDGNAVPEGFEADAATEKSKYQGKLKISLKNDVLTLKGKIRLLEITETEEDKD